MSKGRHRPFREVARRLRRRVQETASPADEPRGFDDVASREGVVRLPGEPRDAGREPSRRPPAPTGAIDFEWRDEEGWLEGWLVSQGARALRGLADDEARATLDLHGRSLADARREVLAFLRRRRARGETVVRVVVGKGRHSDGGVGVLRGAIGGWLTTLPAAQHVRAFVSASPRNGGTGAVMIRLLSPALGRNEP